MLHLGSLNSCRRETKPSVDAADLRDVTFVAGGVREAMGDEGWYENDEEKVPAFFNEGRFYRAPNMWLILQGDGCGAG